MPGKKNVYQSYGNLPNPIFLKHLVRLFSNSGSIFIIYLMAFLLFVLLYLFSADLGIKSYSFTIATFVIILVLGIHYRHLKKITKKYEEEKKKIKGNQPWEAEN